jgi:hypothetical protein
MKQVLFQNKITANGYKLNKYPSTIKLNLVLAVKRTAANIIKELLI